MLVTDILRWHARMQLTLAVTPGASTVSFGTTYVATYG